MIEILLYLATKCAFLFGPNRYRIVDSQVGTSFGGDAWIRLESHVLRIEIARDRGQLLLRFQPIEGKTARWFSLDLVKGMLTGNRGDSGVLDDSWAQFLEEHLADLEDRFSDPTRKDETVVALRNQQRLRMKQLDPPRRS